MSAKEGVDHIKATSNSSAVNIGLGHANIDNIIRHLGLDVKDTLVLTKHTHV